MLDEEQALLVDVVESVVARAVAPAAAGIDRDGEVPADVLAALTQAELPQLLQTGADALLSAVVVSRLAAESPAVAVRIGAAHAAGAAEVDIPPWTAPVDARDSVTARRDGDAVALDGAVEPVDAALGATSLLVMTRECLAVLQHREALTSGAAARTGLRGAGTARVELDGVRAEVVGDAAAVEAVARHAALVTAAAAAVGVADAALDQAREYLLARHQFGQALAGFAALRAMVGSMAADVDAAWGLVETVARRGSDPERAVAVATRTAVRTTIDALQLHGGYGYTQDFPVERMLRDALSLRARAAVRTRLAASADTVLGTGRSG